MPPPVGGGDRDPVRDAERPFGVDVALQDDLAVVPLLFGEAQGRIVVSCDASKVEEVLAVAERHGVPAARIGTVGEAGGRFEVRTAGGSGIDAAVGELAEAYYQAIPRIMDDSAAAEAADERR